MIFFKRRFYNLHRSGAEATLEHSGAEQIQPVAHKQTYTTTHTPMSQGLFLGLERREAVGQ